MSAFDLPTEVGQPLVIHGDCLDELARLPSASVDVVITDPPAAVAFMGKDWDRFDKYQPRTAKGREIADRLGRDSLSRRAAKMILGLSRRSRRRACRPMRRLSGAALAAELRERAQADAPLPPWALGFVAFMVDVWSEVDRVLKPGAYVCAWALPKTADLAGLAMRAVGWDVAENLTHIFGSGMAKAGDLGKKIDAMLGAEREVVGVRSIAYADSDCWGTPNASGSQNVGTTVDGAFGQVDVGGTCTITAPATPEAERWTDWSSQLAPGHEQWLIAQKPIEGCTPERLREVTGADYAWTRRDLVKPKARAMAVKRWPDFAALLAERPAAAWSHWAGRSLRPDHPSVERLVCDGEVVLERDGAKFSRAPIKSIHTQLLTQGCGAMNIGATRVPRGDKAKFPSGVVSQTESVYGGGDGRYADRPRGDDAHPSGSWPKNAVFTEGGEHCPVAELDRQSGMQRDGVAVKRNLPDEGGRPGITAIHSGAKRSPDQTYGSSGGASRFFNRFGLPLAPGDSDAFGYHAKNSDRRAGTREDIVNDHSTPKSVALMSWLVRLFAAKAEHTSGAPAIVLDVFGGSGTTAVACIAEQVRCVIIERDAASIEITRARVAAAVGDPEAAAEANAVAPTGAQMVLL